MKNEQKKQVSCVRCAFVTILFIIERIENNQNVKQRLTFVIVHDICVRTQANMYTHTHTRTHKECVETVEGSYIRTGFKDFGI